MMQNNQIKDSINRTLSLLPVEGLNASDLLVQAKGGRKVKKQLSVTFILAIVLIAITVTALAVVTIREVGRQIAENEKNQGYFLNWTIEEKTRLIKSLIDLNYMENSNEAANLIGKKTKRPRGK